MQTLQLDHTEYLVVSELFSNEIEELRSEIRHTDNPAFKEQLKERERILHRLLARMDEVSMGEVVHFDMS